MAKLVDDNGFWEIKSNPITKEGVYPYLGRTISRELEPGKVYNVYRSFEEISNPETLRSFDGVPFINEHEMLGEGFTDYDQRPAAGVLMNPKAKDGIVVGDLKIFSEKVKDLIAGGKKELSLGYKCEYVMIPGTWNGIQYDAVQRNIRGNHIALVDRGRMGADVRVYDNSMTCDAAEIVGEPVKNDKGDLNMADEKDPKAQPETKKGEDASVDKRKLIDEIGGMLKDKVSEEEWRTIVAKCEKIAYNGSEESKADDEKEDSPEEGKKDGEDSETGEGKEDKTSDGEKEDGGEKEEAEDACSKDEMYDASKVGKLLDRLGAAGKITEEGLKAIREGLKDTLYQRRDGSGMDSMDAEISRRVDEKFANIRAAEKLASELSSHIGEFACDGMSVEEVAKFGCKKLGLDCSGGNAESMVRGYLAGCAKSSRTYSMDNAETPRKGNFLSQYTA